MDNDHKGLLVKSKQNKECVHWAENKGYYDVALSRYYYSIFQKVIYILKERGCYEQSENYTHGSTVDSLIAYLLKNKSFDGKYEFFKYINDIKYLKMKRNNADYGDIRVSKYAYQDLKSKCELAASSLDLMIEGD